VTTENDVVAPILAPSFEADKGFLAVDEFPEPQELSHLGQVAVVPEGGAAQFKRDGTEQASIYSECFTVSVLKDTVAARIEHGREPHPTLSLRSPKRRMEWAGGDKGRVKDVVTTNVFERKEEKERRP
jgi:hypothetical protein